MDKQEQTIKKLEIARKAIIGIFIIFILEVIILLRMMFYILISNISNLVGIILVLIISMITIIVLNIGILKYYGYIENKIIAPILEKINKNFKYIKHGNIAREQLMEAGLYGDSFDRYYCKNCIKGTMGNKEVEISEIKIIKTSENDKAKTDKITIFKGIFITINLDYNFKNQIRMIPNMFKDHGVIKGILAQNKASLENTEFEKVFDVYSEDQIYTRQIMTLTLMEKLVRVVKKLDKKNISIICKENHIYISVENMKMVSYKNLIFMKLSKSLEKITNNFTNFVKLVDCFCDNSFLN